MGIDEYIYTSGERDTIPGDSQGHHLDHRLLSTVRNVYRVRSIK